MKGKGQSVEELHDRIVGGHIHNTLIFLQFWVPVPIPLILLLVLFIGLGGVFVWLPDGKWVVGIYLFFVFCDWLILKNLPENNISFAPVPPPLLIFAMGRAMVIFLCGILPLSWGLRYLAVSIVQVFLTACALWGMVVEPFRLQLTELKLGSSKLQPSGDPLTILQLSDIHMERITRREIDVIARIRELSPDIIVITGDFLNFSFTRDTRAIEDVRWFLSQMSAPLGIYAVRGTCFIDLPSVVPGMLADLDPVLLESDYRIITYKGHRLCIAGLPSGKHPDHDRPVLEKLLDRIPEDVYSILLYHSPDLIPDAEGKVDLYLGGHTHGGQVCLPFLGPLVTSSKYGRRYISGLFRQNGTVAYISRGLGMEGLGAPRIRFFCPPELVLITLSPQ